jgi:hypothetical protein
MFRDFRLNQCRLALVILQMLFYLGKGLIGFRPGLLQTLLEFALMLDLLLDARQFAADAVTLGLDLGQCIRRINLLASALLDLGFGMTLAVGSVLVLGLAVVASVVPGYRAAALDDVVRRGPGVTSVQRLSTSLRGTPNSALRGTSLAWASNATFFATEHSRRPSSSGSRTEPTPPICCE